MGVWAYLLLDNRSCSQSQGCGEQEAPNVELLAEHALADVAPLDRRHNALANVAPNARKIPCRVARKRITLRFKKSQKKRQKEKKRKERKEKKRKNKEITKNFLLQRVDILQVL